MKNPTGIIVAFMVVIVIAVLALAILSDNSKDDSIDYSDPNNWMYAQTGGSYDADLFYIYPTMVEKSDRGDGCANITDEMKALAKASYEITGYAFSGYTNVFAPYYRQVVMDKAEELADHDLFYDFAKGSTAAKDIYASLDYYFENFNNGRPFILAGDSQGSCFVLVILEDYMLQHPEYYERMVAAYAIGFGVTQDYLDRNPHIKFANGATDTGVLISWNTEGPPNGEYKKSLPVGENSQVINPLTWSRDTGYADKSLNKGEYKKLEDGTIITIPGVNDAQINAERGSLTCTTNTKYTDWPILGDVSLHEYDYRLYFKDIQDNGKDRIEAYFAQ